MHEIITAHDGRIEVDSKPGRGTTLGVILLAKGDTPPAEAV
ncbi:MAG: hypothetical protein P8R42_11970 [Candidatus Binatia bacterium]|nr:hypothetical protein [Candidatus Binatia bacterium]